MPVGRGALLESEIGELRVPPVLRRLAGEPEGERRLPDPALPADEGDYDGTGIYVVGLLSGNPYHALC